MKKTYIKPNINVVRFERAYLLSSSTENVGVNTTETYSGTFNSRGFNFTEDIEEEE